MSIDLHRDTEQPIEIGISYPWDESEEGFKICLPDEDALHEMEWESRQELLNKESESD